LALVTIAAAEVGPALFLSLLIITFSFLPIFTLQGQEGRLFAPLAFTKTYAMAAAAFLSITLIPVLMGLLIKGKIPSEEANPLNRWLIRIYRPAIDWVLARPKQTLLIAVPGLRLQPVADQPDRRRVPAADERGRSALHALRAAGPVGGRGGRACSSRPTG
jgi:Cu/Ag efflux pump CusA